MTTLRFLSMLAVLIADAAGTTNAATMPDVMLTTDPRDPDVIVGSVHLDAGADAAWDRLRRVDEWGAIFTDLRQLQILRRGGARWAVRSESAILKGGPRDMEIHLRGDRTAEIKIEAPGVDATGTLAVSSDRRGSRCTYRLRIHVAHVAEWFGSERELRDRQWRLVGARLTDLQRAFGSAAQSSAPGSVRPMVPPSGGT